MLPEGPSGYEIPDSLKPIVAQAHAQLREWGVTPPFSKESQKPPHFRNNFWCLFNEFFRFEPHDYILQIERHFPGLFSSFFQNNEALLEEMRPLYQMNHDIFDPLYHESIRLINAHDFEALDSFVAISGLDHFHFHFNSRLVHLLQRAADRMQAMGMDLDKIQGFR